MHTYMHAYTHACMHACIHTYMYAYMHTERQTERQTLYLCSDFRVANNYTNASISVSKQQAKLRRLGYLKPKSKQQY